MRQIILFSFALALCGTALVGQTPLSHLVLDTLESSKSKSGFELGELITHFEAVAGQEYLYALRYAPELSDIPQSYNFHDEIEGDYFKVVLADSSLDHKAVLTATDLAASGAQAKFLLDVKPLHDNYFLIGIGGKDVHMANANLDQVFFAVLDQDFNLVKLNWQDNPIPAITGGWGSLLESDTTFTLRVPTIDTVGIPQTYFFNIDLDGNIRKHKKYPQSLVKLPFFGLGGLLKKGDTYYSLPFYTLDAHFDLLCSEPIPDHFITSASIKQLSGDVLYGGTLQKGEVINGVSMELNTELLLVKDDSCMIDTLYSHSYYSDSWDSRAYPYTIDIGFDSQIYFVTYRNGEFGVSDNSILINSLDKNGTVKWSYEISGENSYLPYLVIPSHGGGCIVVVNSVNLNAQNSNSDILFFEIKRDGLVQNKEVISNSFYYSLTPNPCTDFILLNGPTQSDNATFCIFNEIGRQIISKKIAHNRLKLNVLDLPKGLYFYQIKSNYQIVESGKFIKN